MAEQAVHRFETVDIDIIQAKPLARPGQQLRPGARAIAAGWPAASARHDWRNNAAPRPAPGSSARSCGPPATATKAASQDHPADAGHQHGEPGPNRRRTALARMRPAGPRRRCVMASPSNAVKCSPQIAAISASVAECHARPSGGNGQQPHHQAPASPRAQRKAPPRRNARSNPAAPHRTAARSCR